MLTSWLGFYNCLLRPVMTEAALRPAQRNPAAAVAAAAVADKGEGEGGIGEGEAAGEEMHDSPLPLRLPRLPPTLSSPFAPKVVLILVGDGVFLFGDTVAPFCVFIFPSSQENFACLKNT
jgi:hypothetical protein